MLVYLDTCALDDLNVLPILCVNTLPKQSSSSLHARYNAVVDLELNAD